MYALYSYTSCPVPETEGFYISIAKEHAEGHCQDFTYTYTLGKICTNTGIVIYSLEMLQTLELYGSAIKRCKHGL